MTTISRIQASIQELKELETTIRYYVYNDTNMTLPSVRQNALQNSKPWTWTARWGTRFADYAKGEIRWLQALEMHPMRTHNVSEAAFFVVPIPVGATYFWATQIDRTNAFRHLLQHPLFQKYPEKHVSAFATTEKVFTNFWGLSKEELKKFKPTTVVRDSDVSNWNQWLLKHDRKFGTYLPPSPAEEYQHSLELQQFSHVVALGYGGEGSNPDNAYQPITAEQWHKKTYWFFYHSREAGSANNSTIFRHALLPKGFLQENYQQAAMKKNVSQPFLSILQQFQHQPVTIGYDIPPDQWNREFSDSKFCLIIRGDQPASRSMARAVRAGCMPLVISDSLPAFQPLYSKTIQYNDFAVIVKEDNFIKDPIRSLDGAVSSLSEDDLQRKLEGLRLMQRIVACDQPDSLFVPAFAREIVQTMNKTIQIE